MRIRLVVSARNVAGTKIMLHHQLKQGVDCVKDKLGLDPATDTSIVWAVYEVCVPYFSITIDADCGWTIQQTCYHLHKLADVKLLLAEQPNKAGDPVALAELRRRTISPIMADQSVFNLQNAWHLSYYRAADITSA